MYEIRFRFPTNTNWTISLASYLSFPAYLPSKPPYLFDPASGEFQYMIIIPFLNRPQEVLSVR